MVSMMGEEMIKQPTHNESLKDRLLNMSDEEFSLWSKERYGKNEKEYLPYKTIVFKQNERGFYSDDLHKIVLLDNHDVLPEIEIGVPYIVEVVRDTVPTEERKGAIIVKVIKSATAEDIIKNKEIEGEVHQLSFLQSKQNPNEVFSRDWTKITLVDKNSTMKIVYKDEVIGRIVNKGNVNVFKPLLKATPWQKFFVEVSPGDKLPSLMREVYKGIKRVDSNTVWPHEVNFNEIVNGLNETDKATMREVVRREQARDLLVKQKKDEFNEAVEKATSQAWQEYFDNQLQVEKVDNDQQDHKVKVGESWQTVSGKEIDGSDIWEQSGDWRRLIAVKALEIVNNDKVFIASLNKYTNKNYNVNEIANFQPEEEIITGTSSDRGIGEKVDKFRQLPCKTVTVNLPYVTGELIFEPVLVRYDDVHDSDWGRHRDDSTGVSYFKAIYKLQAEKLKLTAEINALPAHISVRLKHLIDARVNSLTEPKIGYLPYVAAEWMADYESKMAEIKKLGLDARFELLKPENKEKQIARLLQERFVLVEKDFADLQTLLPVEEYGCLDGSGGVEYFGLPVSRKQATKSKHFSRSTQSVEVPDVGQYKNVFPKYGKEQLSFWLDQHAGYFKRLAEKRQLLNEHNELPKLGVSIEDEEDRLRAEVGLQPESHYNNSHYAKVGNTYLNVFSCLSDDFSRLNVVVNNLDRGFKNEIENAPEVYNFISDHSWLIGDQVLRILVNSGVDKNKAEKLLQKNTNFHRLLLNCRLKEYKKHFLN